MAFIKGRTSSDNVLLVQELFNMFRFSKSKKALMAINIDMEHAYDSMAWPTLKQVLESFDFPLCFSNL